MLKINVLSNVVGSILNALLGILFVPIFIKYIGTEGYGLMGVFASIQTVLYLLDMGLSTTLNRELAQYSVDTVGNKQKMIDTTRTFELVFLGFSILAAIIAIVISYFFAQYWVNPTVLTRAEIFQDFVLLSLSFAFMLPKALYYGGLLGLQKHLVMNVVNVGGAVIKNVGALAVLVFIEASPKAFFQWQVLASIIQTGLMAVALWHYLPKGFLNAHFDAAILRGSKNFALGLTGISITAIILTQADKVILSKILTLENFGYYSFAALISSGLLQIISAVFQAYFPKFSQQFAAGNEGALAKTYHQASKFMALVILPIAALLVFFSKPILEIWTHNNTVLVQNSYIIVSILTLGTALNGLMNIPYALSLAGGWTKLIIKTNIWMICFLIPLTIVSALYYGGVGAASVWLGLNIFYIIVLLTLIHRRFLQNEQRKWIVEDVLPVFLITMIMSGVGAWLMPFEMSFLLRGLCIGVVFMISFIISARVAFPNMKVFNLK